jgi:peptidoglycan hydrolase-like protein with peptidoglycan-binding domain
VPHAVTLRLLQRSAGNQAVVHLLSHPGAAPGLSTARLLQRQPEAEGPLTPGQVQSAIAFYRAQPRRYTADIMRRIQAEVAAELTGVADAQTAQAVARFQQAHPPLKVDGKAGPRTLPRAFPSGLATEKAAQGFAKEAKKVQGEWEKLGTAAARAQAFATKVNAQLAAAGIPSAAHVLKDLGPSAGALDFTTWTLELGQKPFSKATVTDAEASDIAGTVYHEARHAEQWHMMARYLAGRGRSAATIATEMGIPAKIAADAKSKPLKPGSMEALIAEGWHENVYGAGAERRNQVLTRAEAKKTALDKAKEAHAKNPTPANKAKLEQAQREFDAAEQQYRDLPEENDAFAVADQMEKELAKVR